MFPIVLVHGIARFDQLSEVIRMRLELPDGWNNCRHYFKNIKSFLEENGVGPVHHSYQDFAGSVELRAEQLADQIDQIVSDLGILKVNLIAHSMGGLDARHAIVDFGISEKVASLTTIGTPHLGTVLADHVLGRGGKLLIGLLKQVVDLNGFEDLTVIACQEFNLRAEPIESSNGVLYQTLASAEESYRTFFPLVPSNILLTRLAGPNDGLVPVSSQMWKPGLVAADGSTKQVVQRPFPFPADHLNQIGWWDPGELVDGDPDVHPADSKAAYEDRVKHVYLEIARAL